MDADIVQIAARSATQQFARYILPTRKMSTGASDATDLTVKKNQLYHHGQLVETVSLQSALQDLISFLKDHNRPVLIGHNAEKFDSRLLYFALHKHSLFEQFKTCVKGFGDTLPMCKELFPNRSSYRQESLVKDILKKSYGAHDATEDVSVLFELLQDPAFSMSVIQSHCVTVDSIVSSVKLFKMKKQNVGTLMPLVSHKALSRSMADKIAASGLSFQHLQAACRRGGIDGLTSILSEMYNGRPRATSSKKIIESVHKFFSTNVNKENTV